MLNDRAQLLQLPSFNPFRRPILRFPEESAPAPIGPRLTHSRRNDRQQGLQPTTMRLWKVADVVLEGHRGSVHLRAFKKPRGHRMQHDAKIFNRAHNDNVVGKIQVLKIPASLNPIC
ncbi:MAG: hypothetical protein IPK15_02000 [Verrucomicrobia bacterium]|nr:hypothetical protein [Verrucomicrobiota bacterium]